MAYKTQIRSGEGQGKSGTGTGTGIFRVKAERGTGFLELGDRARTLRDGSGLYMGTAWIKAGRKNENS